MILVQFQNYILKRKKMRKNADLSIEKVITQ